VPGDELERAGMQAHYLVRTNPMKQDPLTSKAPRAKVHWLDYRRSKPVVLLFNREVPVGSKVLHAGVETVTESPAACDRYWRPCVFVRGVEEPVLLVSVVVL
jgi:hypothetical protein